MTQGLATASFSSSATSCRVRWRICCRSSTSSMQTEDRRGEVVKSRSGREAKPPRTSLPFLRAAPTRLRSSRLLLFLTSFDPLRYVLSNLRFFSCFEMRSAKAVVSENLARLGTSTMSYHTGAAHVANRPPHTITSLRRWSIVNKELPRKSRLGLRTHKDSLSDNSNASSRLPDPCDPRLRL